MAGTLWLGCIAAQMAAGAGLYSIEAFGPPGHSINIVTDLNNQGQVVGDTIVAGSLGPPFLFQNGVFTSVGASAGRFWAINDSGVAVGGLYGSTGSRAIIFAGGTISQIAGLENTPSSALGIHNNGDIVGSAVGPFGPGGSPFLIHNGVFTDLGPDLAAQTGTGIGIAYSINAAGQIAGTAGDPGAFTGQLYVWSSGNVAQLGVNAAPGWIVLNESGNIAFDCGAFVDGRLWSGQELGFCPTSINDRDEIVGHTWDHISYLWVNGQAVRLDQQLASPAGWTSLRALAINNLGQIAGRGNYNGASVGFLMTPLEGGDPIPEPGGALLTGAALLVCIQVRRSAARNSRI